MSEHETGGSGDRKGHGPEPKGTPEPGLKQTATADTRRTGAGSNDPGPTVPAPRGLGWGQGSRFGAGPEPVGPVQRQPRTEPTERNEAPKPRKKKPEPTHPRHTVAVISSKVTIHRDKQGTPHIKAKQEHDAWAALGFCCAQDRLWQMDILRRIAIGRMAEILGPDWLMHDSLVRTAGVRRRAGVAAQRLQGVAHEMLAAYAGGVNAARALGQPPEAVALQYDLTPWTVADSLALELYWAWSLSCQIWPRKLLAVGPLGSASAASSAASPDEAVDPRASLWARLDMRVADWADELRVPQLLSGLGFVTPTAKAPQLATQINTPPGAVGLPYAAHLRAPGLNVAGLTIPGTPVFIAGRNSTIAWAGTPLSIDDVDLVMEELDGIGNFRGPGAREKAARRQELIRVRGAEDRRIEVVETRHGPILSGLTNQFRGAPEDTRVSVAVRWGANSLGTSQGGWLALARASDAEEAAAAAELLGQGPVAIELLVADTAGVERRLRAGRRPTRSAANQLPVRGWHGESRWRGVASLENLPAPTASLPATGGIEHDPLAAARARLETILAGEQIDGPGAALVLSDVADATAGELAESLGRALDPETRGGQLLGSWNGAAVPDTSAASFFWLLLLEFLGPALVPVGLPRPLLRRPTELLAFIGSHRLLAEQGTLIREAAQKTEDFLLANHGSDWRWDRVCQAERSHLLGAEELFAAAGLPGRPLMGSPGAIYGVGLRPGKTGLEITTEPSARLICDLNTTHAALVVAGGSSGISTSIHFTDQAQAFTEGRLTSFPVDADVEGELTELLP